MKYTIKGMVHGRNVEVTWSDGLLSGDAHIVSMAHLNAAAKEGCTVGWPGGSTTKSNHLADPLSASYLIYIEMDEVEEIDP